MRIMKKIRLGALLLALLSNFNLVIAANDSSGISLPAIFNSEMVLQRRKPICLWGWADAGTELKISLNGKEISVKTAESGRFEGKLPAMEAGGPYQLTFKTANGKRVLNNVMIGELWVCSGQSNMEMALEGKRRQPIEGSKEAIKTADFPNLRLFHLKRKIATKPQKDCTGKWKICTPQSVPKFSATAFFFGRKLVKELKDIPVGLIMTAWGGTPAEAWTSPDSLKELPEFTAEVERINQLSTSDNKKSVSYKSPTVLYNGMINPIIPLTIRGVIWYQGEGNSANPDLYLKIFPNMVKNWRQKFNQGDFPFYYVQIAPYRYKPDRDAVGLRDVQRKSLKLIPNSGMVCIMDKTTLNCIHPPYKKDVGERLANWALAKDYGQNITYCGPLYRDHKVTGNKIIVSFDYAENGLTSNDKSLEKFEIAGEDGKYNPAKAVIDGISVVVTSDKVSDPKHVRYGWHNEALAELWNKDGLPASSFRTDK